ncbi:MAG: cofactor-independent phosphoglycerate mutase [Deltaproteobacteria bacterium RIFOXYD12_FULL_57_12]|nr:MAG: cofactor-independent phosphoglycerate mutase [Deltaproteobacteria bacterium RIFOXYD12_FULL_57_12]
MKYAILVGDGMGDLPVAELGGRTPLEAAATPAMDYVARHGELFLLKTIPDGYPPGSDVANLSLLGYQPQDVYSGRAPLEAASMGIRLAADEIACRCNLVTLNQTTAGQVQMIDYSAGHISTAEARELISALDREFGSAPLRLYPGVSYRHLLVYKGDLAGLTTVPPHDHTGQDVTAFWQRYHAFPLLKNLLAETGPFLAKHPINRARIQAGKSPANNIWLWGEGRLPAMPTIAELYGVSGALISAVDLLKGIGICGGLDVINVPGATGYLDTNYNGKAQAALAALREKDLVFVHVEAPDEAGHQGLLKEKIQAIEDFDQKIVKPILEGMTAMDDGRGFRLVVAMDHYTPISLKTHISLPVPLALLDSRQIAVDSGRNFSEKNAQAAGCLLDSGPAFFNRLLAGRPEIS